MPKQLLKLENFEGGLNDTDDPRDLNINEFASLQNCTVSKGKIVMAGGLENVATNDFPMANHVQPGYGLFAFSSDSRPDSDTETTTATDVIVVWDNNTKKFYWAAQGSGEGNWVAITPSTDIDTWKGDLTPSHLYRRPCFFYLDGALRMSDGASSKTFPYDESIPKPTIWWGFCKNDFFNGKGSFQAPNNWFSYLHDIKAPEAGQIFAEEKLSIGEGSTLKNPILEADLEDGVNLWVRNAEDTLLPSVTTPNSLDLIGGDPPWIADNNGYVRVTSKGDWVMMQNATYSNYGQLYAQYLNEGFVENGEQFWEPLHDSHTLANGNGQWSFFTTTPMIQREFGPSHSMYIKLHVTDFQMDGFTGHVNHNGGVGGEDRSTNYGVKLRDGEWVFRLYPEDSPPLYTKTDHGEIDTDNTNLSYLEWPVPDPSTTMNKNETKVFEFPYREATAKGKFLFGETMSVRWFELQMGFTHVDDGGHGVLEMKPGPLHFTLPKIGETGLIINDPVNTGPREWGVTYVYDGKQESAIHKYSKKINLIDNKAAVGLTVLQKGKVGADAWGHITDGSIGTNHRISGANFYFYDKENVPYRVAECDFRRGLKASTSTEFPSSDPWTNSSGDVRHTNSNVVYFSQLPTFGSYQSYNGFSADEQGGDFAQSRNFSASYRNVAVSGRKLVAGPVYIDTNDGQGAVWHHDMVIAAMPSKYDQFPNKSGLIEVVKDDGDSITALAIYADRLLQFKKKRMYLINISSNAEYLEDTFEGKGVDDNCSVFETDFGIVWANSDGCYLYDGEKVFNLIENKISDSTWATHMGSTITSPSFSIVGYHANSRKIIVAGGGGGSYEGVNRHVFLYDLNLKSWSYHYNVLEDKATTNFIRDAYGDLYLAVESSGLKKWSETSLLNTNVEIITRDIDFENPGQRKNIYKVYITHKGDLSNIQTSYAINGTASFTEIGSVLPASDPVTAWVTTAITLSQTDVYSLQLKFASDGTTPANFEINDISIVYRVKHII